MTIRIITAALFVVGLSGCMNPIAFASRRPVPLSYVGAFSFGAPEQSGRSTVVPLIVDYRTGEWAMNSALVAYGTKAQVHDRQITFYVLVSLPNERGPLELRLPKLPQGDYEMIYADPDGTTHPVGSIKVQ